MLQGCAYITSVSQLQELISQLQVASCGSIMPSGNMRSLLYDYVTRILPALSVVLLGALTIKVLYLEPFGRRSDTYHRGAATIWHWIYSIYVIALHLLSVAFPARLNLALRDITRAISEAATLDRASSTKDKQGQDDSCLGEADASQDASFSVVIIPAYKEELHTLQDTLAVLASHADAAAHYHVRWVYHNFVRANRD